MNKPHYSFFEKRFNETERLKDFCANLDRNRSLDKLTVDDVLSVQSKFERQFATGDFLTGENVTQVYDPYEYDVKLVGFLKNLSLCARLRRKYQNLSSQLGYQDPKNKPGWKSYPKLLPKYWHYWDEFNIRHEVDIFGGEEYYTGQNFEVAEFIKECGISVFDANFTFNRDLKATGGIYETSLDHDTNLAIIPTYEEFVKDMNTVIYTSTSRTGKRLTTSRLRYLKQKYEYYSLLNSNIETKIAKLIPHRDFYNVRKVDNNINLVSSMNKKQLLNMIQEKLSIESDRVVKVDHDGNEITLKEMLSCWGPNAESLNLDDLIFVVDGHPTDDPAVNDVIEVFLSYDNYIRGDYLADIIKQNIVLLEKSKYQLYEYNIDFNFKCDHNNWDVLANWVVNQKLFSQNIRLVVKIQFNYNRIDCVSTFGDYLEKLLKPLFEATEDPSRNVNLHILLSKIVSFDFMNEVHELLEYEKLPLPFEWTSKRHNPPINYYFYYLFVNFVKLNRLRTARNMSPFKIRTHAGSVFEDSGIGLTTENLSLSYLLSSSIINGVQLTNYPVLQYLFYMSQIGIITSPTSDNYRLPYLENPLYDFFKIGLKVSLNCTNPLFTSYTHEPLIEEYSIAASILKLSNIELCEFCRTSVELSGFEAALKRHWIGTEWEEPQQEDSTEFWCIPATRQIDPDGAIDRTKVPKMRLDFRAQTLQNEHRLISSILKGSG